MWIGADGSYGMENTERTKRGNERTADAIALERGLEPPARAESRRARKEPEPPRGDVPDWLAKELFKIFV